MDDGRTQIANISVYEYLVLNYEEMRCTHVYYKLIGVVTAKQVALAIGLGDKTDHLTLSLKAAAEIGPDDYNYWRTFGMHNVTIAAYEKFFGIHLPRKINYQQYKMVEDIIRQVRQFEKDYGVEIQSFPELEKTLEEAKRKLDDWVYIERKEKIVGIPINEQYLIDSIVRELNVENCTDVSGILDVSRIISKYYHDSFFENIILKVVPNAEKIANLYSELFGLDRYLKDISFVVENVSYENIENYLSYLISEVQKKMDVEKYDMMYHQALKENEEFDRHKEEEARKFSEMYEQALKESEEFDRRIEEEKYHSLIEKEAAARKEWEKNKTVESYYDYKNAVEERLKYESLRKEVDEVSIEGAEMEDFNRIR